MKKINLSTLEAILAKDGLYTSPGGASIRLGKNGYFILQKDGFTRFFESLRDAWRAI